MKKLFLLLALTVATICAFVMSAQSQNKEQEKTISINDIRHLGISGYDSSTTDRVVGEVSVNRTLTLKPKWSEAKKDTMDTYDVHFFKMFENKLRNYSLMYSEDGDFDKASYKWLNDTIVSVTLLNSSTKQNRTLKLVQTFKKGSSAGLMTDNIK